MTTRNLPIGVYNNGSKYMAIVRHKGKRHYLGAFDDVPSAAATVAQFREEHPVTVNRRPPWKPGDPLE